MENKNTGVEEDKFRRQRGRRAEEAEKDSEFLNDDGLEDDLIDIKLDDHADDDDLIVSSKDPTSQEWNAREDVKRKH